MSVRPLSAVLLSLVALGAPAGAKPSGAEGEARLHDLLAGARPSRGELEAAATIFVERDRSGAASRRAVLEVAVDFAAEGGREALPLHLELELGFAFEGGRVSTLTREIGRAAEVVDPRWLHRVRLALPAGAGRLERAALAVIEPGSRARAEMVLDPVLADVAPGAETALETELQPGPERSGIQLETSHDTVLVGRQELAARVSRPDVDRVRFLVDGRVVAEDSSEPWRVTHAFDRTAVPHTLEAIAIAADGRELARDATLANAAADQAWLRLLPLRSEAGEWRAEVRFRSPAGRALDRLELWAGQRLLAILAHEPFGIELPSEVLSAPFLRAVARFDGGLLVEDVQPMYGEGFGEVVDVALVEVFPRILDEEGRPARVGADELELLDEGVPQPIEQLIWSEESPLLLGIAVDTSGSMLAYVDRLKQELGALLGFLEPGRDRVFLSHFSVESHLDQPPTSDPERIAVALRDVSLGGHTAIYDGIVHALVQFERKSSRRAIVVLTDGFSTTGRLTGSQVLSVARRLGVPIYALVPVEAVFRAINARTLDPKKGQMLELRRLVEGSGGKLIELSGPEDLASRLGELFDSLRSQAVVTFTPRAPNGGERVWRQVELRVKRPGIRIEGELGYSAGGE